MEFGSFDQDAFELPTQQPSLDDIFGTSQPVNKKPGKSYNLFTDQGANNLHNAVVGGANSAWHGLPSVGHAVKSLLSGNSSNIQAQLDAQRKMGKL